MYHEPLESLTEGTRNLHRAVITLIEELEAVDWYQQRVEACTDDELRAVLAHNRDEEIEHAMMTLEWLRRNNSVFAENIALYIGSTGPITLVEAATKAGAADSREPGQGTDNGALSIGSLKRKK
ncbi:MAG: encapsulin-associated ferritin-like protein [Myxococcales bacterium]